jgi:hypothetical protein
MGHTKKIFKKKIIIKHSLNYSNDSSWNSRLGGLEYFCLLWENLEGGLYFRVLLHLTKFLEKIGVAWGAILSLSPALPLCIKFFEKFLEIFKAKTSFHSLF